MKNELLMKIGKRVLAKEELRQKIEQDFDLFPVLLKGISSPKATVRYGCARVLMDLSEEYPAKLYPYMDAFVELNS